VSGANKANVSGIYGALGVAATGNSPGGRGTTVSWIDRGGNPWLFGGYGYDAIGTFGELNDLWEFNPVSKEWTWVSGSSAANNLLHSQPGVYGTLGVAAAGNVPGGRDSAVSWADSNGSLWLFGGEEVNMFSGSAVLNDLWNFDPATKEWTWVSGTNTTGSNTPNPLGVYGTLDVGSAGNVPGGRVSAVSWIDNSGNLWLFGGWGYDATGTWRGLNDLWRFSPATKEWTWVSGPNTVGSTEIAPGVYGTLGTAAASNVPGGRNSAVSWLDGSGDLWLFGGTGFDSTPTEGYLNDLWKYQP
jgi:N-acetylneuraminic acid mutarotase